MPEYQRMLKSFSSLDELLALPRRHAVTGCDIVVPGADYVPPLPARGTELTFALPLGPEPPAGWQAEATIEIASSNADAPPPSISVNGVAGELRVNDAMPNGNRQLTYSIPPAALPGENGDAVKLFAATEDPIKVLRVEVRLYPGE